VIVNFTAPKDMPPAQKATAIVHAYAKLSLDASDPEVEFAVFIVWFSKTLQNWKALVSTTLPDLTYYEVTYDGDRGRTYLDVYRKIQNITVMDAEEPEPMTVVPSEEEFAEATADPGWSNTPLQILDGMTPNQYQLEYGVNAVRAKLGMEPIDDREPTCVAKWPECHVGGYDPRCCRFPKSCSCWKEEEVNNDTAAERADDAPVQAEDRPADNLDEGR
jgi:hypothetical protein